MSLRTVDPEAEKAARDRFQARLLFVDGVLGEGGERAQQLNIKKHDWEATFQAVALTVSAHNFS